MQEKVGDDAGSVRHHLAGNNPAFLNKENARHGAFTIEDGRPGGVVAQTCPDRLRTGFPVFCHRRLAIVELITRSHQIAHFVRIQQTKKFLTQLLSCVIRLVKESVNLISRLG